MIEDLVNVCGHHFRHLFIDGLSHNNYWNCSFYISPHDGLSLGWLVGLSIGRWICHVFHKGGEIQFLVCSWAIVFFKNGSFILAIIAGLMLRLYWTSKHLV